MADLKNIFSVLFCIVVLGQIQAVEPNAKTDLQLKNDENWSKAVGGLRCRIEPTRKRFLIDDPISFRITFENTGKKTFLLRGVGQSHIYEAGDFYFNDQKVGSMPSIIIDSQIRPNMPLNPDQSKAVSFTLRPWGATHGPWKTNDPKIPQKPNQYKVRFHYAGAMFLDSGMNDDGFISSQSPGEIVSNTVEIEIAEKPSTAKPGAEIESLKETLEKVHEAIGKDCYIFDTVIRGTVSEESEKYHFLLIHNPRTSKQGRKEAAEIVKWSLGSLVVAENDEYFLLVSEQPPKAEKQEELIAKICALLNLEANNIRRDMEHYLIEETKLVAHEMGGQMVLTLHPGILWKEIGSLSREPGMEDLQKFMQKYPEERYWHAHLHGKVAAFLQRKNRFGEALEMYQKMIDEYGDLVLPMFPGRILAKDNAQLGMADCYRQMGATDIALEILDNLKSQTTSRMIRRMAEKEYEELRMIKRKAEKEGKELYEQTFDQGK
ncbi:MAG TPA: tetratricopeptide repeat protein [Phycisphaerales bacterium]|nr:tetratricopeptide repeat protein [Phycisphaerales bacterium]